MAQRTYVGVVSSCGGQPPLDPSKVRPIIGPEEGLEDILPSEIAFWRFIAEYYLCTVGDVYKMVYPAQKTAVESRKAIKKLSVRTTQEVLPMLDFGKPGKPLLVNGWNRDAEYEKHISRALQSGRDVLLLRPGARQESFATQRELAKLVRGDSPVLVEGSRSCLFLPFTKLGLVIVDDEHSPFYKRNLSPRYNARDAAVFLARIHGAEIILGSGTPSLESLYNVKTGKYCSLTLPQASKVVPEVVDTLAELRKNGMVGERSRILLEAISEVPAKKYLEINSWELTKALGGKIEKYSLVALMGAEYLLSRNDFRADERASQLLEELCHRCRGRLIVQTKSADHPLFAQGADPERLLSERAEFKLPPYTRLVEYRKPDEVREPVRRFFLEKGPDLNKRKQEILNSCPPDLIVDVDPV